MSFRKLAKPRRHTGTHIPQLTIGMSGKPDGSGQAYLALNSAARKVMGDPVAVILEWDEDDYQMRIVASSPEDPDSYRIIKGTGRISVTGILRELGIDATERRTLPVTPQGRIAVLADLSELPAARTAPTLVRRAS